MYSEQELNHLRWECRRGMRELDLIIQPFFDEDFLNQTEDVQRVFIELLNESDLMLFRWLLRGEIPDNKDYVRLIDIMLECHQKRIKTF
ncbi:MAG: succinate dehydrogenase assembly factor 2 [Succinivibrionaceae bacterium]